MLFGGIISISVVMLKDIRNGERIPVIIFGTIIMLIGAAIIGNFVDVTIDNNNQKKNIVETEKECINIDGKTYCER